MAINSQLSTINSKTIHIVAESDDWIVVDKPPFLEAHPSKPNGRRTLWDELRELLSYELVNGGQVSLINRLDRETSGLTLVAKHRAAARELGRTMMARRIEKEYLALVWGWPADDAFEIDAPILRQGERATTRIHLKQMVHPDGAAARTGFRVERRFTLATTNGDRFALVRAFPATGRMHQIRVHLAQAGHPVVGDKIYGPDEGCYLEFIQTGWTAALAARLLLPRHALHSAVLRLPDANLAWQSPLPPDLAAWGWGKFASGLWKLPPITSRMSRYGKCQNFSGCLLAYRGEETELENDQPFICAECGKPLAEVRSPSAMWMRYVYALGGVTVLGLIIVFAVPSIRHKILPPKPAEPTVQEDPGQGRTVEDLPPAVTPDPTPVVTPEPTGPAAAEPPRFITAPARIDLDVSKQENKTVKAEVLTRVDLMPISEADKDKLYQAVERAQSMGKILTIPFASAKSELTPADLEALRTEMEKPEIAKLRGNPTAVFVILGYADPKGDAKKNLAFSQARADAVLKAMKEKLKVFNLMHTMGMGGSKLLDAENLEKNRIVEIWAVLP